MLFLIFQLFTHAHLFAAEGEEELSVVFATLLPPLANHFLALLPKLSTESVGMVPQCTARSNMPSQAGFQ